jgi:hypothetical protein
VPTPVTVPAGVLTHAQETLDAAGVVADAATLIGGRAAMLRYTAPGLVSAGGATRMLGDGRDWCALTLARPDDVDAVPALVGADRVDDPWVAAAEGVGVQGVAAFADRARLHGLPVGIVGETAPSEPRVRRAGPRSAPTPPADWLVADLTSMWAGPLCGRLLQQAGATVVKVESPTRPDGTRAGPPAFCDWMNGGKLSYVAPFDAPGVRALLAAADVVLVASRPAALHRHGLGPDDVPARPGRVWVQITGHGGEGEPAGWVAFGDDAAASGGLVAGTVAAPRFCGDALADPLTGIHATAEVVRARARGGGQVVTLSMAAVAAEYARHRTGGEIACATAPLVVDAAPAFGVHTGAVDRLVAARITTC